MSLRIARVKSASGTKRYVVSIDAARSMWQCSCPAWTRNTPRKDCKHIVDCRRVLVGWDPKFTIEWIDRDEGGRYSALPFGVADRLERLEAQRAKHLEEMAKKREREKKRREDAAKHRKRQEQKKKEREAKRKEEEKRKQLKEIETGHDAEVRFGLLELD